MHRASVGHGAVTLEAEVIFHVAGGDVAEVIVPALELAHDVFDRLSHHAREHVDAPAMRHRDRDVARAGRDRFVDGRVEHRNERVGALDRESLVAGEGAAEEALETVDFGEPHQQRPLFSVRKRARQLLRRKQRAKPLALFFGAAVHELDREISACNGI